MTIKRLFRSEGFLLKLGAQFTIFSVLCLMAVARGTLSMLTPVDLIALLSFNLLIWCRRPVAGSKPWLGVHLYLALQSLFLSWLILQDVVFGLLFFILYVQAMLLAPGRSKLAWMLLFISVVAVGNFHLHPGPVVEVTPALRAWIFQGFLTFVTLMIINQLRTKRKNEEIENLLEELAHSHRRLQDYAEKAELLAAEEERNRISRELHDTLGHRLVTSIVLIENLPRLLSENRTQRAVSAVDDVSEQLHEGLQELRAAVHALRTTKIAGKSLNHLLLRLTDEFAARHNASVWIQLPDARPPSLSDDQSMAIYRIVQETLTNTSKHAPHAQNIFLTLKHDANQLILTVRNDGRDFAPHNGGPAYGLQGMRERAALLGGTLTVKRPDGGGTLVKLTIPLEVDSRPNSPEIRKASDVKEFAALPAVEEMR
ncbi:MAG: sensor histidine kinase [Caldilineaceae bacterium]|nr:sensor histidine kinase [Caldilineaceae bacterium]